MANYATSLFCDMPIFIVDEEADKDDVQKYYDLFKKAEMPLHDRTKHSKLSAIVHLYNLKRVGRLSNTIFLSFLEFINQLLLVYMCFSHA